MTKDVCAIGKQLRVGFDLHGVIEDNPKKFKKMMQTLRCAGAEVFIISGPTTVIIQKELDVLGFEADFHYDGIYSVVDFLVEQGVVFDYVDGNPWTDSETWWKSKGQIAKRYDIHWLIDDSSQYAAHVDAEETIFLQLIK